MVFTPMFILAAQHCGSAVSDIQDLLKLKHADSVCVQDVCNLAIEKKLRIEHKLRALQAMSHALDDLIQSCGGSEETTDDCPILSALENSLQEVPR